MFFLCLPDCLGAADTCKHCKVSAHGEDATVTTQDSCRQQGHNLRQKFPNHCTARENRQPHDFDDFGFSQGYVVKAALSHQNPATPTTPGVCFKLARSSPRGSACPINSPATGPPRPERPLGAWSAYSPVSGMLDKHGPQHPPRGA